MMAKSLPSLPVKQLLPRTLFGRSLLIILIPVVLVQVITTYFFFDRHWSVVTRRLTAAVAGEIATVAEEIEILPAGPRQAAGIEDLLNRQSQTLDLQFTYRAQAKLPPREPYSVNPPLARALSNALAEQVERPFVLSVYQSNESIEIQVQLKGGVLQVLMPERRIFSRATYIFLLWMIGSGIILTAVALIFMRNQIRPIRRLAAAAEGFGKGRDFKSFKPEGALEVRQAARAFLDMRDRIRRQLTQRTEMLAGVSHDLRTPLTRMKLQLALLPPSPDVEALHYDITEMETMVEGYLAFARGEDGEAAVATDLANLVEELVQMADQGEGRLYLALEIRPIVAIRRMAVQRAIMNLLQNARRYAPHAWVTLRPAVTPVGDMLEIVVDDDGPGIPEASRADVFRPFFRLDASRNRATGGVGLGLPITLDIARTHGGDVILEDSPQGGLRAILRLPA
jgi:two-component system osmolarity sensor histidine kinase EnvZ